MAHPVSTGSPAGGPGEDGEEEHGGEIVVVDETAEEQKERQCRGRPTERPGKGRAGNQATRGRKKTANGLKAAAAPNARDASNGRSRSQASTARTIGARKRMSLRPWAR